MTIRNFALTACMILVSACDLSVDTSTRQEVIIEGIPHYVFQINGTSNSYLAHETNLTGGLIDPNDYRQNVMAIEAVTGCTIDTRTIINSGLLTRALVIC